MSTDIALWLLQDGLTTGAIYALLALALLLVFAVTRVIFVPQGEFVALAALTLGVLQQGRVPGTVWLLLAGGVLLVHAAMIKHVFPELQLLRWLRGVGRLTISVMLASLVVESLRAPLLGSGLPEVIVLVLLALIGTVLYAGIVLLVWRLDRFKDGPERSILTRIPFLLAYAERRRSPYDWIVEGRI